MLYKGKKIYEDIPSAADDRRLEYLRGIEAYIERKNSESKAMREDAAASEDFIKNIEIYRQKYRNMLGIDSFLSESVPDTERVYVGSDDLCDIYRLRVFITEQIPMYALLFLPRGKSKAPLFIAQHGGGGTPELCSDLGGKNNYSNMVLRLLERGAAVIAPQLLLWSTDETETFRAHPIKHDRKKIDNSLKRFGTSITALEIAGIIRCIDYGITLDEIDGEKVGMIGLSYGGYFALHTMAADSRISVGCAAGFFNSRDVYDWSDWCYKGSALMFQDAEVGALCLPRHLWISVGKEDTVFDYHTSLDEGERLLKYFTSAGCRDNVRFSVWDGGHTIENSDECYEFMFQALERRKTKCME
jgi:dienelactone hydrolase